MRGLKSHTKGREHKKRDKNIIINRDRNHVSLSIDAYNLLRTHICIKRSSPDKPLHSAYFGVSTLLCTEVGSDHKLSMCGKWLSLMLSSMHGVGCDHKLALHEGHPIELRSI